MVTLFIDRIDFDDISISVTVLIEKTIWSFFKVIDRSVNCLYVYNLWKLNDSFTMGWQDFDMETFVCSCCNVFSCDVKLIAWHLWLKCGWDTKFPLNKDSITSKWNCATYLIVLEYESLSSTDVDECRQVAPLQVSSTSWWRIGDISWNTHAWNLATRRQWANGENKASSGRRCVLLQDISDTNSLCTEVPKNIDEFPFELANYDDGSLR